MEQYQIKARSGEIASWCNSGHSSWSDVGARHGVEESQTRANLPFTVTIWLST
ncbi:hypothetical protein HYC85_003497 [Camellia sinensis]|uniref:Uncharacterized protein n=1 Tax=Camellia sinensis TaxID=4442 RepID=A0A7J7HTW3_CAMSI|nr:hypothetical protein HYC85_003497 [Camellia sinensis]